MTRQPRFYRHEDAWWIRGPLKELEGRQIVIVRRKDNTLIEVEVDPETLTPLDPEVRTQWDGRKPHIVKPKFL